MLKNSITPATVAACSALLDYIAAHPGPSEKELADEFGISRPTIRHRLAILEREKLITRTPGKQRSIRTVT